MLVRSHRVQLLTGALALLTIAGAIVFAIALRPAHPAPPHRAHARSAPAARRTASKATGSATAASPVVGAPSIPPRLYAPASCTSTLAPGASVAAALQGARGGAVICLSSGDYDATTAIDLSGITPASNVTLEAAPGATVKLGWLDMSSENENLTVQGVELDGGVSLTGAASNITFQYDTVSGSFGATSGFYFYGDGKQQTNIKVLFNQMDHLAPPDLSPTGAGQCVTIAGTAQEEHDFDVSYNVCGPGIANHYTQVGGIDGLTEDHNTFLGPAAPEALRTQQHNNVLQVFGDSDGIDFSNNLIRDTDSRGQTVLIEEGQFSNLRIDHNLWDEDSQCLTNWNCYSYAFSSCASDGLQFDYNTVIDSHWGTLITNSLDGRTGCRASGTGYSVTHNVFVGTNGGEDISYAECMRDCVFDYNATQDASANRADSTHYVIDWAPHWTDPASFSAAGLPFAAGYDAGG